MQKGRIDGALVVADSVHVGPCLIDAAVYDAFAIEPDIG